MNQRLIQQIGRSQRLRVVNELKRTQGLAVKELAARLGMSYMGIKDMCVDLEKRGFLDTWRQPQKRGRPLLLYRLTERAQELFPAASNPLTLQLLEASQALFGAAAPEKLLFRVFQQKTERYRAQMKGGGLWERATHFAQIRDREGCMSVMEGEGTAEWRLVEHHCPILDLMREFPLVARLEGEMVGRVLGVAVRREEQSVSGLYSVAFVFRGELGAAP